MVSGSFFYKNGHQVWSVTHQSQKGVKDLSVEGEVPEVLTDIRNQLLKRQDEAGDQKPRVDYVFDVPVQLAAELCGYRHDRFVGGATFTRLEPATR
jgi:hypothetical protein